MKKSVLTILLALCTVLAFAQPDFSNLKYGLRGGIGIGSVDTHHDGDLNTMGGFAYSLGVIAEMPVWKAVRLTAEVNFEHSSVSDESKTMHMEGTGLAGATIFTKTKTKFPLTYIHIPVLARLCFAKDIFYVEAGPQLGILAGKVKSHTEAEVTTKPNAGGSSTATTITDSDDTDHFTKGQFALALGWGFNFGHYSAGLRFGIGIGDIQAKDYAIDGYRVNHTDFQVGLRYWF